MPNVLAPMDGDQFIAKTRSLMASKRQELSSTNSAEENAKALEVATKIFRRYPDYSKAPQSYIVSMVELLATYPEQVRNRLADIRTGITARCKFLPTLADVVELAEEIAPKPREWVTPASVNRGPNFTHERLAREAEQERLGLPPEPEFKSRVRHELKDRHALQVDNGDTPEWLKNPDPNAPWRKQEPPSQELIDDYQRHRLDVAIHAEWQGS